MKSASKDKVEVTKYILANKNNATPGSLCKNRQISR